MKVATRCFVSLLLVSMAVLLTGFASEEKNVKATWLWHTTLIASEPDQIVSFAEEQGVNLLYLQIDTSRKADYYRSFIRKAHEAGVSVHALGGDPSWGLQQNRGKILALVDWVIDFNLNAADEEKIRGIHLDIEPYLHAEWKTEKDSVLKQWMGNVEAYTERAGIDSSLEVGCDIPFWLDKTPLPEDPDTTISEWLISKHDHVAVMSYRDRVDGPNSMSSIVTQELSWADELGKKVLLGAETKESSEGDIVSFAEEGKRHLDAELSKLPALMSAHPSFGGTAIHSYEYWKLLKDE